MSDVRRRRVVRVYGPVPPPVHGAAKVTQQVLDRLHADAAGAVVRVYDTGAEPRTTGQRLRTMLRGLAALLVPTRAGRSVYVAGAGGELLWFQAVLVGLARLTGHRVVFHHHNVGCLEQRTPAMTAVTRLGGARVLHVVLCDRMESLLRSAYPAASTVLAGSNAAMMPGATAFVPSEGGSTTLGHLSNLTREKGVHVVLDSLRVALAAGLDVRLVLAGPCVTPDVADLVAAAQDELGPALEVLGPLAGDEVDAFYRRIDVFLFPSDPEAEGIVALDAMRHGVPTVAYEVGCLPGIARPEHVVPRGGDFPAAVVAAVTRGEAVRDVTLQTAFEHRRASSVDAHDQVLGHLVGA